MCIPQIYSYCRKKKTILVIMNYRGIFKSAMKREHCTIVYNIVYSETGLWSISTFS